MVTDMFGVEIKERDYIAWSPPPRIDINRDFKSNRLLVYGIVGKITSYDLKVYRLDRKKLSKKPTVLTRSDFCIVLNDEQKKIILKKTLET